jgi:hypothetical protein
MIARLFALAFTLLVLQAAAQQPNGAVSGRVVSAQTGEGIGGVSVQIAPRGRPGNQAATTAPDGSFSFPSLFPGEYLLSAQKQAHQPAQQLPIRLKLEKDQSRTVVEIRLHRPGVITGRIKDAEGLPVVKTEVTAYRLTWPDGHQTLVSAGASQSDDRGEYRISGLPAGRYVLAAAPPPPDVPAGDGAPALVRTFYPSGARASQSTAVAVNWGQEVTNTDFELRPQAGMCIAGHAIDGQAAAPCCSCALRLNTAEEGYSVPIGGAGVDRVGGYRFCGLSAGAYRISMLDMGTPNRAIASRNVQLGKSDLRDADVVLGAEHTVAGRLVFDSPPEDLSRKQMNIRVRFRRADTLANGPSAEAGSDGSFSVEGLSGGTYLVQMEGVPGGYLKSLRLAGRDLPSPQIDIPEQGSPGELEIVAGFDSASVEVTVKSPDPAATGGSPDAVVALFPTEGSSPYRVQRRVRTGATGSISLTDVAPGTYLVYAFAESGANEWDDPEVRRRFPNYGRTVELSAGKREKVELTLLPDSPGAR